MKRIKLTTQKDLESFKRNFEKQAGNAVSLEYLRASEVYGFKSGDELKAGYVIHAGSQHRFFDLMKEIGFDRIKPLPGKQEDFCEITCMWVDPDVKGYSLRVWFYSACMMNTFSQRKPYIIGGTKAEAVARRQKFCLPHILFHDDTENSIGSGKWYIYYGTPWTFTKGFVNQLLEETRKAVGMGKGEGKAAEA